MSSIIYVASPYTHEEKSVEEHRYQLVKTYIRERFIMIEHGVIRFSPIVYWHPVVAGTGISTEAAAFAVFNREMLARSDSLEILALPGWKESLGVDMEINWAEEFNIPYKLVHYRAANDTFTL